MCDGVADADEKIEFVGGPFDGYWHPCDPAAGQLPAEVAWLISDDAFRQLERDTCPQRPSTRIGSVAGVAFYGLDCSGDLPQYRFAGAVSVANLKAALQQITFGRL